MNERTQQRLAIATLVLLPLIWLWPCVFGGKTLVPFDPAQFPPASLTLSLDQLAVAKQNANYDVTEIWPWLLPEMELAQQAIQSGELPLWNPHARTGTPLHEPGVLGVFYPPHWLWMFGGDPKEWLVYLTWISIALAGVFAFGLLRQIALSPLAAFFGAATFELAGTMAANGYFFTRLPALAWLPAMLWALLRLAEGDRLRPAPLAAVAISVALPWCAGFPPYAAAGLVIAGLLAVRLILERAAREGSRSGRQLIYRLALGFGLGVLLAMPQLLPTGWFYAFDAARSANPGFQSVIGARFEPYGLLGYLMPDAFGHPITASAAYGHNPLTYLWGNVATAAGNAAEPNFNYTEYSVFAGTLALLLAGYGLLRGRRGHMRGFATVTLALLIGLALLVPVVNLFYYLPLVKNVPPMRWLAPGTLLLAWLAAIGVDRLADVERRSVLRFAIIVLVIAGAVIYLTRQPAAWHAANPEWPASAIAERFRDDSRPDINAAEVTALLRAPRFPRAVAQFETAGHEAGLWLLLCGGLLLAHAFVRPDRGRRWVLLTLPLTTIVQLGSHGRTLLHGHELAVGTETEVHEFLRERAAQAGESGGFMIVRGVETPANLDELPTPLQLPPGFLNVPGIRDLNFYNHGDARSIEPLRRIVPQATGPRLGYLRTALPDSVLAHPLLDLLGVRYVLSVGDKPLANAGPRVGPHIKRGNIEFFIQERPNALARAFTVPELRLLPDAKNVLATMKGPRIRFDRVALGERDEYASPPRTSTGPAREVRFVRDEPSVVELDIAAGDHPHLVLTDAWFPGWTATIDGEPADIGRCNHSMRLLRLPQTACRVRFEFASPLLPYGFALFVLALIGLTLPFVLRRRSSAVAGDDETAG